MVNKLTRYFVLKTKVGSFASFCLFGRLVDFLTFVGSSGLIYSSPNPPVTRAATS
jgi:hypothetical protein